MRDLGCAAQLLVKGRKAGWAIGGVSSVSDASWRCGKWLLIAQATGLSTKSKRHPALPRALDQVGARNCQELAPITNF